jgi:predicted transcriptional regulator
MLWESLRRRSKAERGTGSSCWARGAAERLSKAQIAEGRFESIKDAVEVLVSEERRSQEALDNMDLSWAQPYIDKGLADLEAGRVHPPEEVFAELRASFVRSRGS